MKEYEKLTGKDLLLLYSEYDRRQHISYLDSACLWCNRRPPDYRLKSLPKVPIEVVNKVKIFQKSFKYDIEAQIKKFKKAFLKAGGNLIEEARIIAMPLDIYKNYFLKHKEYPAFFFPEKRKGKLTLEEDIYSPEHTKEYMDLLHVFIPDLDKFKRDKHGFVDEPLPEHIIRGLDREFIDFKTYSTLHMRKRQYKEKKNPVYLIEAFLVAYNEGLYPDKWILDSIADVFQKYHKSLGEEDMESLFGFKRGPGQETAFKEVINKDRDQILMLDIVRLKIVFGIDIDDAAEMIAARIKQTKDFVYKNSNTRKLKAESIKHKWNNEYCKFYISEIRDGSWRSELMKWTDKEKKEYLALFPEESLPLRFR